MTLMTSFWMKIGLRLDIVKPGPVRTCVQEVKRECHAPNDKEVCSMESETGLTSVPIIHTNILYLLTCLSKLETVCETVHLEYDKSGQDTPTAKV